MNTIDEYLDNLPPGQKKALQRVRDIVLKTVLDAEEVISYGMPTFKKDGKQFLNMSAFKDHLSLFGNVDHFADQLQGFTLTGRGTVQFTEDKPIPEELIKAIVLHRIKENS